MGTLAHIYSSFGLFLCKQLETLEGFFSHHQPIETLTVTKKTSLLEKRVLYM